MMLFLLSCTKKILTKYKINFYDSIIVQYLNILSYDIKKENNDKFLFYGSHELSN